MGADAEPQVRSSAWVGGTGETVGRSERRWWELQTWDTRYDVWLHVNSYTDEQEAVEAGERFAARPPQEQGCRVICVVEETLRSWGEVPPTS
jgi:hypothetical protein